MYSILRKVNLGSVSRTTFIQKALLTVQGILWLILICALNRPVTAFATHTENASSPPMEGGLNITTQSEQDESVGVAREPHITLNGGIEFNAIYLNPDDVGDDEGGKSTDVYLSTAELILRAFFSEWIKAKVVVTAEDIGRHDESGRLRADDALLTVETPWAPFYLALGKTGMPFGVFEDHLIEGTLTEELYEVDQWGATLGFAPDYHRLDISLSVYRNPQVMENLEDFNTHEARAEAPEYGKFESFIANVSLVPMEEVLALSVFYDNEPGDGTRNQSLGGALTLLVDPFTLDLEYITALTREKGENGEENLESAAVAGLALDLLEYLQLSARYEVFQDDTQPDRDEVLMDQWVAGCNVDLGETFDWTLAEDITLTFEYRHSRFEREVESEAAGSQDMAQIQLTLEF